ncbi:MAG: amidohydrolase family protein [Desulfomonile tiedjei]|uniref:Amidohydrolase family protein n=1 Tax=Desulfomonile tiedjei TaxID=2358 RepID=A0A9D6V2C5_9BACT|nr:amidohydrolase family protein [Desulfomonile tiedjei]
MRKAIQPLVIALVILPFLAFDLFAGGSLLVRNARLVDGTDAPVQEGVSVLIQNGRIAKIGKNLSSRGTPELDVGGSYVLPGLIDGHVHLDWGPGVLINNYDTPQSIKEWEATWGKNVSQYLRAYLACGVTTVLNASAPAFVIQDIRRGLEKGNPGPRFLSVGQLFSPPKGYAAGKQNKPVSSHEEAETKLDVMQSLGVIGIKVPIEKGWSPFGDLPRHSPDMLRAIKEGAAQRNLPIYVHATCEEDFSTALDMKPHALMHTLVSRGKEQLSKSFIERMASTKTYQVSTLSIMDAALASYEISRLNEPLLEIVVPESELARARDPIAVDNIRKLFVSKQLPWLPKVFLNFFVNVFYGKEGIMKSLQNSKKAIYDLHKAGVNIVMGSDAVPNNAAIYSFHGFTSLREIELLGEAGLSPKEAIKAATVNTATMVGLEREIGTIEVGKRADLVVLRDNPLKNLTAFRTVRWTIKDGIAKTPKEWMN